MAVRGSMSALIARVRVLIGDTGTPAQFPDQTVQDYLDMRRVEVRYAALDPRPSIQAGTGVYLYSDFYADAGQWEADEVLTDASWNPVTPTSSDETVGHWTFSGPSFPLGQLPPLRITGKTYDLYGSAADLLEQWATALALKFDFSASGNTYNVSQQRQALMSQANRYRAQARPGSVSLIQSDQQMPQPVPGVGGYGWTDNPNTY